MKRAVYIPKSLVDESLGAPATEGKKHLEPLKTFSVTNGSPINILENRNKVNPSEIHVREADLWICIEGSPIFTVGGSMINGKEKVRKDGATDESEILGDGIEGGEEFVLTTGDMLYIPAGVPHMLRADGTARMYIVKIPEN